MQERPSFVRRLPQSVPSLLRARETVSAAAFAEIKQKKIMKNISYSAVSLIIMLVFGVSSHLFSQERSSAEAHKKISAEDKAAIKEIFKGVDPAKYRLEFDGGKDTMGSKKVSMADVKQTKTVSHAGEEANRVTFIARDSGVVYCYTETVNKRVLEGVIGKEKVARLNQIMAKYPR